MAKKTYALVGCGSRARFFYEAVATTYKETSEMVAFCDLSPTRMNYANKILTELGAGAVATYKHTDFEKMIAEKRPDFVIVTSVDRTHDYYIIKAMELGCDVITEKPMTIDEEKAQAIIDAQKKYGRSLRVTFNYRYAPHSTKIRELIMNDTIGEVFSIHFEWLLDIHHGADYYRRWHRNKLNSGGLLVHKSTHHFDLVNFWLGDAPKTVFAMGDLRFYGMKNAERRGVSGFYDRAHGNEHAKNDPFAIQLSAQEDMKAMYLDAEEDSGYIRDRSVFSDDVAIEDVMGVLVKYNKGALLTYSLNTFLPWEGFNVVFNGSKGRIEMKVVEKSYVSGEDDMAHYGEAAHVDVRVFPMFAPPYEAEIIRGEGGHGGGDPVLLNDIFGIPAPDPFNRAADHVQGAMSILTGIAANKSIASGTAIKVRDLVNF
ncbi:MAG: Gfo/Idh/MocA family oxidoreductase [Defluviitaleaceae bacterium]|nr:Gfo/Idh/MocA family oxidoreductase [Defluviitaleaceae bacterium]MCL2273739.1 Gfo/Idh/MocA family oxidoreductase [Defluviitaleaceae bacterium]